MMVVTDDQGLVHLARVNLTRTSFRRLTSVVVTTGCHPSPVAWSATDLAATDYPTEIPSITVGGFVVVKYQRAGLSSPHPTCVVCAVAPTSL